MSRLLFSTLALVLFSAGALSAADTVTLTFYSTPPGASFVWGTSVLTTPASIRITTPKGSAKAKYCGVLHGRDKVPIPAKMLWVSGASVEIPETILCSAEGKQQGRTIVRPTNAPGADLDVQYAIRLKELELQRSLVKKLEKEAPEPCVLQMAPNGTYVYGTPHMAPDGSWVGGQPQLAPNGKYVGKGC